MLLFIQKYNYVQVDGIFLRSTHHWRSCNNKSRSGINACWTPGFEQLVHTNIYLCAPKILLQFTEVLLLKSNLEMSWHKTRFFHRVHAFHTNMKVKFTIPLIFHNASRNHSWYNKNIPTGLLWLLTIIYPPKQLFITWHS